MNTVSRLASLFLILCLALVALPVIGARADDPPLVNYPAIRDLYEGRLTESQQREVYQWAEGYWNYVETGQPSEFEFSENLMKSALFNPLRATRFMLEKLNVLSWRDCDQEIIRATPDQTELYAKRALLKAAMTKGKFITSPLTNQEGTSEHFNLIFEPYSGANAYFEDGQLTSEKLKLKSMFYRDEMAPEGVNDSLVMAFMQRGGEPTPTIDTPSLQALVLEMYAELPALVSTCEKTPTWKSLITGLPSLTDQLELKIQDWLAARGREPRTQRFDYAFQVYGSLPVIAILLDEGYVIIDGQKGTVEQLAAYETPQNIYSAILYDHVETSSVLDEMRAFSKCGAATYGVLAWTPYTVKPTDTLTPSQRERSREARLVNRHSMDAALALQREFAPTQLGADFTSPLALQMRLRTPAGASFTK